MSASTELWGYVSAFIVFVCGFLIAQRASIYFGVKQRYSVFLYLWHTVFCLVYLWYASWNASDAIGYFNRASQGLFEIYPGTPAVVAINSIFVFGLGFSLLGAFLVNNIFGFLGLLAFKGALDFAVINKGKYLKWLAWLIVLLPSISFWSSALGKDSISFMATGFALWAALKLEKHSTLMAFAIFMMFLVRPHMAGMLIIALALSMVLSAKVSLLRRVILGTLALGVAAALVPFALQYAGVSDPTSAEAVMDYMEGRQGVNMGGSYVDIASMSLPMKLFTYVFRPTVIDARNIFGLAAAFDNLILLFLFVAGGYALIKKKVTDLTVNRKFMWIYVALAWFVLAMTTANLGIAIRQKWMFAPMLIFLLISLIGKEKKVVSSVTSAAPLPRAPRLK